MIEGYLRDLVRDAVREALDARADAEAAMPASALSFWEPQAAELIGIKAHALRDLRRKGLVEAVRLGGRICYRRESLVALLEQQRIDNEN
ncbi:hypothetical protein Pan258_35160 [Symmachiella dynata]|uniref:helix-turn-helix domain-containing protein n=1 Tax=Symmachiella dynata TaxID=2527995 RepID=UPI0011878D41|nr:helix-turn-helix domain-containing protein [Symmachiella dynata]QDT49467.1 hypothetical protein Pan258_35160 [Symmachiella dynata]